MILRLFLLSLAIASSTALSGTADRIVAIVGNQIILESQVQTGVELIRLQLMVPDSAHTDSLLRAQVLEQLISDQIILEQARRETLTVTKEQVDAELRDALRTLKARFASPDSFAAALQREGLTEAMLTQRYREEITQRLTAQLLLQKHNILENIAVTPTEVKQFYLSHRDSFGSIPGRVKLAHILIVPRPDEQVEMQAYQQIVEAWVGLTKSGWDFEATAGSFSTDDETRRTSGFVGRVERGELPPEIDSVLFRLEPGTFSQPFRSRYGWQIVKRERGTGATAYLRQILVRVPTTGADTQRAYALGLELRRRALAGEDFPALARQYSDDPTTKMNGGELGEFFIKGLAPPYAQAVETLKAGQVSMPIQSEHGFHVIKVLERVEEQVPSYEELQDDIRNYLYNQKLKARLEDLVKEYSSRICIQRF